MQRSCVCRRANTCTRPTQLIARVSVHNIDLYYCSSDIYYSSVYAYMICLFSSDNKLIKYLMLLIEFIPSYQEPVFITI